MEKYIIKRKIKFNGEFRELYHESLKPSNNKSAMNVYVENVVMDRKKAMVFYSKREADAMAIYLVNSSESTSTAVVVSLISLID